MLLKIFKTLLFLFLSILLMHTLWISVDGLKDEMAPANMGVVFGNEVSSTGEPSERLKSRLDKAIELYNKNQFPLIMVSGGIDPYQNNEAEVMKTYLVERGIPESSIIVDSKGENTAATALNAKAIMDANKMNSVLVVSQFYHISRIKLAFAKLHIQNVSSAHTSYYELRDLYSLIREFFAYYKYLLHFPSTL